jgi:hypothetical protein
LPEADQQSVGAKLPTAFEQVIADKTSKARGEELEQKINEQEANENNP